MSLQHMCGGTLCKWGAILSLLALLPACLLAQPVSFSSEIVLNDQAAGAQAVFCVDVDGDGDLDLLSASSADNTVEWFENTDGEGTFSSAMVITDALERASAVYGADLDGDGDIDVISDVAQYDQKIVWFENTDGLGEFSSEMVIATNTWNISTVFSSDVDGDDDQDVLSAEGDLVKVYKNSGAGSFSSAETLTEIPYTINSMCTADLDGDDDLDLLTASGGVLSGMVSWNENIDGFGHYSSINSIVTNTWNFDAACSADLDGDGDLDVFSASSHASDNRISWSENTDGAGNFAGDNLITTAIDETKKLFSIDLDGDGDTDLISASSADNKIAWYENTDGAGTFGEQYVISDDATQVAAIYCADLDGDGDPDIAAALKGSNSVVWYRNLGFVGVAEDANAANLPVEYELGRVYPNPFNPSTTIEIALPHASHLDLIVYNTLGEQVALLSSSTQPAGLHSFTFDGTGNASGLYFVRAFVPGQLDAIRKIVLMK